MYDYHIHTQVGACDTPEEFLKKAHGAGIDGGGIISIHPVGYHQEEIGDQRWEARLEQNLAFTNQAPGFHPIFWIDPTDSDAMRQIQCAAERGVAGFKVICNHFYPGDCMNVWQAIAEMGLPVNFHSGILYSTSPASCFNRPLAFECLMTIPNLRFSMAHVGWPWADEYISLVGEFNWGGASREMYVDLTPGTPAIYRREVLRKLYLIGFLNLKYHVLWGSDNYANSYRTAYARFWLDTDKAIMDEITRDANLYTTPNNDPNDYSDIWNLATHTNMERFLTSSALNH